MSSRPSDNDILSALFVLAGVSGDLSLCPYYQGTGTCMQVDVCTYSMGQPEPMCQTCVPDEDGWPLDQHPEVQAWMLAQIPTNDENGVF